MPSIILDAGHGGFDNGAQYGGRREKDDTLTLTLAVGEELKERGYDVIYTRTEDVYDSPGQKARIANASGGDYFISFHRNSSPNPNTYSGAETLVYEDEGIVAELARNINRELSEAGLTDLGVTERKNLAVLRRTQMPAILVEAGFINTDRDNETFDQNFAEIVQGIADGIEETLGEPKEVPTRTYRVQIGLYRTYARAEYNLMEAVQQGYDGIVVPWRNLYAVQLGDFDTQQEAENFAEELQRAGYDTLVVLEQ